MHRIRFHKSFKLTVYLLWVQKETRKAPFNNQSAGSFYGVSMVNFPSRVSAQKGSAMKQTVET
jgi:hypothetical protein